MDCCKFCNVELTEKNWSKWTRHKGKAGAWKCCKPCYNIRYKESSSKAGIRGNPDRMYVNGKYISRKHPLYKPGKYKTFSDAAFDGTYKLEAIKEGYVYAITNPAWPEWVKIGMAVDADDRCNGYQTSSPFRDYSLAHMVVTNNRRAAEAQAHKEAAKIAEEQRGEWFKISIEQAKDILNKLLVSLEKAA